MALPPLIDASPQSFFRRLLIIGSLGAISLLILGLRLYDLQVIRGAEFQKLAQDNTVVLEAIPAPRGRILDRHGLPLVSNLTQLELAVIPSELKNRALAASQLALFLKRSQSPVLDQIRNAPPLVPLVLQSNLSATQLVAATELSEAFAGIQVRSKSIRRYPQRIASHLLGYVSEITAEELRTRRNLGYAAGDPMGKVGLEWQYDRQLRGTKGLRHITTDVLGRTVTSHELRSPRPGADLYLNLDLHLQAIVEQALTKTLKALEQENQERSGGAVVVMDASTGAIRALASLPQYDLPTFTRGITNKEYQALLQDTGLPLIDRAVGSAFSPGSTFKLITASAALQGGYCSPGSHFYCGGSFMGAGCFLRSGHGGINFEDALAYSCDVVFYQLGLRMGIQRLRQACLAFGLGKPTGVDLPGEISGLVPSPQWKQKVWNDRWYDGDTINTSIGQGFLLVTPIQMAVVTAAVANGGRVVTPRLAQKMVSSTGVVTHPAYTKPKKLPIDENYLRAVRTGMRGAVTRGTAVAADSPYVEVAGKTGTVENSPSVSNRHGRNHTWFVSFAPYDHPKTVCVVFLEKSHGYGGGQAAPIARKVYDYLYQASSLSILSTTAGSTG